MQPGFTNEQRYWLSSEGNAIWYTKKAGWHISQSSDLGTSWKHLYLAIKDPSKECPHDKLKSNWKYYANKRLLEDVSNSVRIHCLKGK